MARKPKAKDIAKARKWAKENPLAAKACGVTYAIRCADRWRRERNAFEVDLLWYRDKCRKLEAELNTHIKSSEP